jgi:hypothetical protein
VPLSVSASVIPLSVLAGTSVNFTSIVSGGNAPYSYRWDLGDGTVTDLSNPRHSYSDAGVYSTTVVVTDADGNRAVAKVVIAVAENPDIDGDGILNADDSCPQVYGPRANVGCPVVSEYAGSGASVSSLTVFGLGATLSLAGVGGRCTYSYAAPKGAIFGKTSCDSCPCAYGLDFLSDARHCDLLFPAILSPDKKNVYSRGTIFELR